MITSHTPASIESYALANIIVKIAHTTNEIEYIYELSDFVFSLSRFFIGLCMSDGLE